MQIGVLIKELRLKNQLTQEELANRCELTKGYISQIENDLTSPSIATLTDLLSALGSTLGDFFGQGEDEKLVFTHEDCFEKITDGSLIRWLIPSAAKNAMEPILFELEAGETSAKDLPHDGEEFGYLLEGKLTITVGSRKVTAKQGDSFYFRSGKTHFIKNTGSTKARLIWVSCPPNF